MTHQNKPSKPLYKVDGGVNDALARSKRNHPSYKAPKLTVVRERRDNEVL